MSTAYNSREEPFNTMPSETRYCGTSLYRHLMHPYQDTVHTILYQWDGVCTKNVHALLRVRPACITEYLGTGLKMKLNGYGNKSCDVSILTLSIAFTVVECKRSEDIFTSVIWNEIHSHRDRKFSLPQLRHNLEPNAQGPITSTNSNALAEDNMAVP